MCSTDSWGRCLSSGWGRAALNHSSTDTPHHRVSRHVLLLRQKERERDPGVAVTGSEREGDKPLYKSASCDLPVMLVSCERECMYACCALGRVCYCVTASIPAGEKVSVCVCTHSCQWKGKCVCVHKWQTSAGELQTGPDILARSKYTSRLSPYSPPPQLRLLRSLSYHPQLLQCMSYTHTHTYNQT